MKKLLQKMTGLAALLLPATAAFAAAAPEVAVPVAYTAPSDGFVSLAVYNARGQLVRSLMYAQPVKAGPGAISWDGTSDLGVPQPAGSYTARGIFFQEKPKAQFVMMPGKSGNPPYRTPDGKGDWGGNLGGPAAICSNANSVMMVWGCVEDNQVTGIQQMDAEGNILMRYFSFYPWDTRLAGAMDERQFYLGILNAGKKQVEIAVYQLGVPRGKILIVLPTKPHATESETRWRGRFTASIDGMALTGDSLYATICDDDALFVIDRASGQIRRQVTIPSPRDVKVSGDGLLVQSGNTILRLTLTGDVVKTLVPEGTLTDPRALAVGGDGVFYSSGAHGSVAAFTAEGKRLGTIGQDGGAAKTGHFNPNAIGQVASMCLSPKGDALWVQDVATGFPRTSRWSLDGKLQREWFCPKLDLFAPGINPARPNELVSTFNAFSDEPGIRAYELDWARKTWRPGWFYDNTWAEMFQGTDDVYLGWEHGGNPLAQPRGRPQWPIFHYAGRDFVSHGGHHYFMNSEGNDDGVIYEYGPDRKPKPVASVGFHHVIRQPDGRFAASYDQGPNQWMTWADRNGDGKIARDEITHVVGVPALEGFLRVSSARLDADLNVHLQMLSREATQRYNWLLPPKEILPGGVPVYDWTMVQKTPAEQPDFTGGDGTKAVRNLRMPLPLPTDDGAYAIVSPEPKQKLDLPGIDGPGWWASRNWRSKLVKFDSKTGAVQWAVGRRAPGRAEPGQMYHPVCVSGKGGDVIFVADTLGPVWLWHADGLFIGHLFKDHQAGDRDVPVDQEFYGEIQSSHVFKHPQTGQLYHIGSGNEVRIHELTLPPIQRLAANRVTLGEEQAKRAQAWDPDGLAPTEKPICVALRAPGETIRGHMKVKVDGDFSGREGWGRPVLVMLDGQRLAEVRVMYDQQNLYLGYSVSDAAGAVNAGSELPFAPFVSGAYVDFCIAPDWAQPQRREVRAGDLRVIVARTGNGEKDAAIFQQGFWQKKSGGNNPQTIASPAASVHFDQIAPVPGLQAAYKLKNKEERTGNRPYSVEIAVPLASLGLQDVAGKTVGFDISVGVANPAGDQRERAAHWAGVSEGRVVDRPGSSELLPHTWGTLQFAPSAETVK